MQEDDETMVTLMSIIINATFLRLSTVRHKTTALIFVEGG